MLARKVAVRLVPHALEEFKDLVENEILPWLQKQEGFLDLITLAVPGDEEVAVISFWDHDVSVPGSGWSAYPEGLDILEKILDGVPYLKTFHVVSSTLQNVTLPRVMQVENPVREIGSENAASARQAASGSGG
jgi:hypothetical protein